VISDVRQSDEGTYVCRADNDHDQPQASVTFLQVKGLCIHVHRLLRRDVTLDLLAYLLNAEQHGVASGKIFSTVGFRQKSVIFKAKNNYTFVPGRGMTASPNPHLVGMGTLSPRLTSSTSRPRRVDSKPFP